MNGVEILSQETIYDTILPECYIGIGLVLVVLFVAWNVFSIVNEQYLAVILSAISVIVCMIIACLGGTYSKTDIKHIELKVTIDDSVSMNEFLDKYEIIDQEGKIYTVKERE